MLEKASKQCSHVHWLKISLAALRNEQVLKFVENFSALRTLDMRNGRFPLSPFGDEYAEHFSAIEILTHEKLRWLGMQQKLPNISLLYSALLLGISWPRLQLLVLPGIRPSEMNLTDENDQRWIDLLHESFPNLKQLSFPFIEDPEESDSENKNRCAAYAEEAQSTFTEHQVDNLTPSWVDFQKLSLDYVHYGITFQKTFHP